MTVKERFRRIYERFALAQLFKSNRYSGNTAGSRERVQRIFNGLRSADGKVLVDAVAKALKEGAGQGGGLWDAGGVIFYHSYGPKGIDLGVGDCKPQNGDSFRTYKFSYTWVQIARMVIERGILDEAG